MLCFPVHLVAMNEAYRLGSLLPVIVAEDVRIRGFCNPLEIVILLLGTRSSYSISCALQQPEDSWSIDILRYIGISFDLRVHV